MQLAASKKNYPQVYFSSTRWFSFGLKCPHAAGAHTGKNRVITMKTGKANKDTHGKVSDTQTVILLNFYTHISINLHVDRCGQPGLNHCNFFGDW
jgi:hypothetical protein